MTLALTFLGSELLLSFSFLPITFYMLDERT